ncbi:DUF4856 domain-containing protein [Nonlabens xiamenensis]|uniref:DUF4856 domain-containing protein n=1 Tax=Nonlabens xiamenensis TaxID=2341043 RepID=UPI000F612CC9|nr:DUF4856 domain-containing protein [Nonlabens xiamenensis]
MKLTQLKTYSALLMGAILLASCSEDEGSSVNNLVEAPATYTFERDNNSTVNFSGQTTRIAMAEELNSALKNPNLDEATLDAMFAHEEGNQDFSVGSLNDSDKNLRSKTAASADYFSANSTDAAAIKADFDGFIAGQANEVFPAWGNTASPGTPGQLQQAGGGTIRYISAKGLEYDQAYAKSLLGALMMDQILNNYLSPTVLDEADNRMENGQKVVAEGKNYTVMEHKWDEAYGYLYGAEATPANPSLGQDSFLSKYLERVKADADFAGIDTDIFDAFKLGRAAIVANDYELRDAQAEIIREKISMIPAIRAVYYLEDAKDDLNTDPARAFHALSEAYGFIYSLQFTRQPGTNSPYFSKAEVDAFLSTLMENNGFWDLTPATLEAMSSQIASRYSFTVAEAAN